ncbi:NAD(P)H-quinone oxidoreductase subunit I, chloroplastic [bioreactor metagenome]|uniref:NAD(P)H-quinone oxidoreductase subunit I, chloroplastic n=1 Tax=bioreactor metagenome TaxID=1076179 RepID=A0A645JCQ6_9ZZZZ
MAKVTINEDACKGCGLCTTACPKGIVKIAEERLNVKGFRPAEVVDMDKCIGCAFCATICPDAVIKVEK